MVTLSSFSTFPRSMFAAENTKSAKSSPRIFFSYKRVKECAIQSLVSYQRRRHFLSRTFCCLPKANTSLSLDSNQRVHHFCHARSDFQQKHAPVSDFEEDLNKVLFRKIKEEYMVTFSSFSTFTRSMFAAQNTKSAMSSPRVFFGPTK